MKIDKNIPMPTKYGQKYPWDEMEVGDSFLFTEYANKSSAYSMAHSMNQRLKATGSTKKFAVRKVPEGYRCWRIK